MLRWRKVRNGLAWLPSYMKQRLLAWPSHSGPVHLIIGLADHFEPAIVLGNAGARADLSEQERRLERWCREYPEVAQDWRDSDRRPFVHTYFYPAEQYHPTLIDRLAEHCEAGWGEIEIHLHHGTRVPDSPENTRNTLLEFRDALARHGCLSKMDGTHTPRYAFVHGNFALANSASGGRNCGVDSELQILAETGCYADLTLPSAPNASQTTKINSLYECLSPLDRRGAHLFGRDLQGGDTPTVFPLIIQGPLMLDFRRRTRWWPLPAIENGALTTRVPPTMRRLSLWRSAGITVRGRPDWVFIKLHCHGMDPRDDDAMLGPLMRRFLQDVVEGARGGHEYWVHFVTAREMVNIILAACDGRDGNPGGYRDYRLTLIRTSARVETRPGAHHQEFRWGS